jgi:hypothetical protein
MKKLALAVALVSVGSLPAHAAALVQIGVGSCSMKDGDGNSFTTTTPNIKVKVATPSGNLVLTCHVDNVPNHTGSAVTYNLANTGSQCMIFDPLLGVPVPTNRWQEVVSAGGSTSSGNADLSCSFNAPSGQ